jgi:hypothetical protein
MPQTASRVLTGLALRQQAKDAKKLRRQ